MKTFISCLFCGSQVKYPEGNASFYRNHLVALHNVDYRFPGMNLIVNQTIQRQIRNSKYSYKNNVTSQKLNVTNIQKTKNMKQKNNNIIKKDRQDHSESNFIHKQFVESNSEAAMLHKAAMGKFN
jgi:hypothetical protein